MIVAKTAIPAGSMIRIDSSGRATAAERHIRIVGEPHQYPWVIDADTGEWLNAARVTHHGLPLPLRGEMVRMTLDGEWIAEAVVIVEIDYLWHARRED